MARTWTITIEHEKLNKIRTLRGYDKDIVEQKAKAQSILWDEQWKKKIEAQRKREERETKISEIEEKTELARKLTTEAQENIAGIENVLKYSLNNDSRIDWEKLKNKSKFNKKPPKTPNYKQKPKEPKETDKEHQPTFNILDKFSKSLKEKKIEQFKEKFKKEHRGWITLLKKIENKNVKLKLEYEKEQKIYNREKENFYKKQKEFNESIDRQRIDYEKKSEIGIIKYCNAVLSNSKYPKPFPHEYELDYSKENELLIVDYLLPAINDLPKLKEVKYIKLNNQFKELFISDSALNKLYDDLIYKTAIRTIHEIIESDIINAIKSVVFNGLVRSRDKSTGNITTNCIISMHTTKEEFLEINLKYIDPKECFKKLKGIGSSKLHSLTPIAPILKINKEDKRFVDSYNVANELNESVNIAAMDWKDFENLIREIFEKEFAQNKGELKITQASKDGGVDAIAFDPDPIKGGKIVIQAKRYTNVVGVSAVRDLYGTVLNEGANKGILVTTATYGPDAYSFAKGKPLTLINGNELLYLLQKHGHKAKIDIREAKKILAEQSLEKKAF